MTLPPDIARNLRLLQGNARTLETLFPSYYEGTKRNHYGDFGWPQTITAKNFRDMYERNPIAGAAIDKTADKTWQDNPEIWESEEPKESGLEKTIRERFDDLRLWQHAREADVRAMACGYSGLIFRFADGQGFDQEVGTVTGGINGLVEIIPAWADELLVSKWGADVNEPDTYGKPMMFQFDEGNLPTAGGQMAPGRKMNVHPDRVLIWSSDGTVHGRPLIRQGYNTLWDIEKILGSSAEGLWKNSKSAPIFSAPENTTIEALATAMGVAPADVGDKLDEMVEAFQKGVDASLLLFGLKRENVSITLPSPVPFFDVQVQALAASANIPIKILLGNITGERASSEDAQQWARHNKSRRESLCRPLIRQMLNRLERFGIIPERDWTIGWTDLTGSTQAERLEMAAKMADIHAKMAPDPVYMADEIREVTGHDPREEVEGFDTDPDRGAVDDDDPPGNTEDEE